MRTDAPFLFRFTLSFIKFFFLCFTVAFLIMAKREFDEVNINQILFHMQLMHDNIVTMPGDFIDVFFWHLKNSLVAAASLAWLREASVYEDGKGAFRSALVCVALVVAWVLIPGKFMDDIFVWVQAVFISILVGVSICFLGKGIHLHRTGRTLFRYASRGWPLAAIWGAIVLYSMCYIDLFTYFREQTAFGDFYTEGDYVDPRQVKVTGTGTKNLLIVYCESIEETFGQQEVMGEDLLAPLRPYIDTPALHIEQMPGADFTIGGIVSSQCGIPLKSVSILSGNLTGWALDRFLPAAVCLGDYLKADGYHNVYFNGSSGVFSGLNKFFLGLG